MILYVFHDFCPLLIDFCTSKQGISPNFANNKTISFIKLKK